MILLLYHSNDSAFTFGGALHSDDKTVQDNKARVKFYSINIPRLPG